MATVTQTIDSVDKWLADNPTAPPEKVIEILRQQAANINQQALIIRDESRMTAEVDFDVKGGLRPKNLAGLFRLGRMYSDSLLVPKHFQGAPADCTIAIQMAIRCNVDPLTFLQACYVVHGRPGIEAKLAIAMINRSGVIKGRIDWEFSGTRGATDRACTAFAIDAQTERRIESTVSFEMVAAEGWNRDKEKDGRVTKSKWNTMPDLMFQYRSAMFLCRLNFPDVLMGMQTIDELEDIHGEAIGDAPEAREPAKASGKLAALTNKLKARSKSAGVKDHVGKEPPEPAADPEVEHVEDVPTETVEQTTEAESEASDGPQFTEEESQEEQPTAAKGLPADAWQRFETCTSKGSVDEMAKALHADCRTDEERMIVDDYCERRKQEITESRGERSNAKGKPKPKEDKLFDAGGGHPS